MYVCIQPLCRIQQKVNFQAEHYWVDFRVFHFLRPFALLKLEKTVWPTIYLLLGNNFWIHAFPRGLCLK